MHIITKLPFKKKVKKGCQILTRSSKKLTKNYKIKKENLSDTNYCIRKTDVSN